MGAYTRPDSIFWQLYLETAPRGRRKEATAILVGETAAQRKDSKALAQKLYAQRMTELATHIHRLPVKLEAETFRAYAALYARDTIPQHRGAERETDIVDTHLVPFFGDDLVQAIDRDRVKEYMQCRLRATLGVVPKFGPRRLVNWQTVNREVDLLKAMIRDAVPKYLAASPLVGMKRLKPLTRDTAKRKKRLLQRDEEARLLAVGDAQDRALIMLGLDSLVRLGDLLAIRHVDRAGLWITLPLDKNGDAREIPLSPRAAAALDAIPDEGPYYFSKFRRAENPRDWRGSVRQRLEYLCAQADPPVPFGRAGITFHGATRKTGATRKLIDDGATLKVVQDLGNWKTPDVLLEIYTEAQRGDLLAAVGQPRPRKVPRRKSA